ncbi:MAG: HEPN domain-containing protein [bacterium]
MDNVSWMGKAAENLAVAEWCYQHDHLNACANRLYYAMFHAALAALIKNGIFPAKDNIGHDWLQGTFSGQLIHRRKLFPRKFRWYLVEAFHIRVAADYQLITASHKNIANELKKAKEFVRFIQEATHETKS